MKKIMLILVCFSFFVACDDGQSQDAGVGVDSGVDVAATSVPNDAISVPVLTPVVATIVPTVPVATAVPDAKIFVTYDGNGSSAGVLEPVEVVEGSALVGSAADLFLEGCRFVCWNTEADGSGIDYKCGDTISSSIDITLYAKWLENGYLVKYILSDDEIIIDSDIYREDGSFIAKGNEINSDKSRLLRYWNSEQYEEGELIKISSNVSIETLRALHDEVEINKEVTLYAVWIEVEQYIDDISGLYSSVVENEIFSFDGANYVDRYSITDELYDPSIIINNCDLSFGTKTGFSNSCLAISEPLAGDEEYPTYGAIHMFKKEGGQYTFEESITVDSEDGFRESYQYGSNLTLSDSYAIIAPSTELNVNEVKLFKKIVDRWTISGQLVVASSNYINFAHDMKIVNNLCLISAPKQNSGTVYGYNNFRNGNWENQNDFALSEDFLVSDAMYGYSIDCDGISLIVSAPYHTNGVVYIYGCYAGDWVLQNTIRGLNRKAFGWKVKIIDDKFYIVSNDNGLKTLYRYFPETDYLDYQFEAQCDDFEFDSGALFIKEKSEDGFSYSKIKLK